MSVCSPTKAIAIGFLDAVQNKDERAVNALIASNITFSETINDGNYKEIQVSEEYVKAIGDIWKRTILNVAEGRSYGPFIDDSGAVSFSQICQMWEGSERVMYVRKGVQKFTFEDEKITEIFVTENQTRLSVEQYNEIIKKINQRQSSTSGCCSVS